MFRVLLLTAALLHATFAVQLSSVLSPSDAKKVLEFFKAPFSDLESAYTSIRSLKQYNKGGAVGTAEKDSACKLIKSVDVKSLASVFYAAATVELLGSSCKFTFPDAVVTLAKSKISEESTAKSIFAAVSVLKSLNKPVDNDEVIGALLSAVKNDNSVASSSFALLAASKLSKPNLAPLLKSVDIEDMAAQADEVDERYLHFENDLHTTSTFLSAVFLLSQAENKPVRISSDQVILFANFILRSKNAAKNVKEAGWIVRPLSLISASSQITVGKAQLVSGNSVSEEKPNIHVSVVNVIGQPMAKLSVKAEAVVRASDNEVTMSNVPLQFDAARNDYKLLFWKGKPTSGFYDVSLKVTSPSATLAGVSDIEYRIKVTTKIAVTDVQLGTGEKDQAGADFKSITYPKKADNIKADSQQRIILKFAVQDINAQTPILPHQVFVRFVHVTSGQEVIFVAEPDKTSIYKFEVDLASAAIEQFNSISGKYTIQLIIGDAAVSNPIFWHIADVTLQLGEATKKAKNIFEQQYSPKPEIRHLFRVPEERPPVFISQAFTIACLLPIALLFILWGKVGANLGNLRLSPKNLLFHAGLAGIFILYYFFWTKLNMFTTIQYLCGVGAITFVFGNSVLSEMAQNR